MLAGNITAVALSKPSLEPVGFLQAYNFSTDWGWAYLLAYFDPKSWRPGAVTEATFLFAEYLFDAFPLRKLYGDIFEYNDKVLNLLRKVGCREEGRFEQHVWFGDRYWALIRMSLFRETWLADRERLRHIIGVQHDVDWATERSSSRVTPTTA